MLYSLLIAFLASVCISALLTRYVRNAAVARGWVDSPDSTRHFHSNPVPRLGGVAIFLSLMSIVGASLLVVKWLSLPKPFPIGMAFGILGPAILVFLAGLYDDLRSLGPNPKFGIQVLAGVILYADGFGIRQFDLFLSGQNVKGILGLSLTVLWVLLITNAFNLIDGLDGLAAGSALFSTLVVFVVSLVAANHPISFLAVVLAGAILGFLRFNFNPATIFLGDSGSLFVGFMLSALALAGSQKAPTMIAVAIPIVSFGLPILDVAIAVLRRILSGKPVFRGDDEHIHHKLLKRGFSQRKAVLILYGVSALFALLSLALLHGAGTIGLVLAVLGIGVGLGIQQLKYHEFSEMGRAIQRTVSQKRIFANDLRIGRATESLNACTNVLELCRILTDALQPLGFDGFSFRLPSTVWLPEAFPALFSPDPSGELRRCWAAADPFEPAWELKLELITSAGDKCGSFSVYKQSTSRPLLVDMNLLTDGFHTALAGAVHRAVIGAHAGAAGNEQASTFSATRAAAASSSD